MGKTELFSLSAKCTICGKRYNQYPNSRNIFRPLKYCSKKCCQKAYYQRHKKELIQRTKMWQQKNPEKARILNQRTNKNWRKNNKVHFSELMAKYYQRDKNKWQARSKARYKIKINPEQKCEWCGSNEKIQRHHPDYDKPTEIIFLCEKCHKNHHKKERN
jgi:hypothetical protein